MLKTIYTSFIFILTLIAIVNVKAKPIFDEHKTSLEFVAGAADLENHDAGRFLVKLIRKDELKANDGHVLSTRVSHVMVSFDVTPQGEVKINDVPIRMGVSHVITQAVTFYDISFEAMETLTPNELAESFDTGLIGMDVMAVEEKTAVTRNGKTEQVNRITIAERIHELNGHRVLQHNAARELESTSYGQIIDIYPNGTLYRYKVCPMVVGDIMFNTPGTCLRRWQAKLYFKFTHLPLYLQTIIITTSGFIAALLTFLITACYFHQDEMEPCDTYNNPPSNTDYLASAYVNDMIQLSNGTVILVGDTALLIGNDDTDESSQLIGININQDGDIDTIARGPATIDWSTVNNDEKVSVAMAMSQYSTGPRGRGTVVDDGFGYVVEKELESLPVYTANDY
ncbi:hypothetical protein HDU76_000415 [Blyttiomyces sp. JEL0837]|nr:hypothetical protein HDU76_000415 [Blyttiomyces sp. JEL0837]